MGLIKENFIESLLDRVDLVDVVSDFVDLKKVGSTYKGKSPFTDEKTASFFVVPSKQIWKDFSSGKGGRVIGFLQETQGLSFPDAVKWLADKYGAEVEFEQESPEEVEKRTGREEIIRLNEAAAAHYVKALRDLPDDHPAKIYLGSRMSEDEVIQWGIGWAPGGGKFLSKLMLAKAFGSLGEQAGLLRVSSGNHYDFFQERILFPIHNKTGRVVGFSGRVLGDEKPKYLNSPETLAFKKSQLLFGLHHAASEIVRENKMYLVEGQVDVIAMHSAGILNTVAPLGTALTFDHCRILQRMGSWVCLVMDGDEAGMRAVMKEDGQIETLLKEGFRVSVIKIPGGMDPDEFIKSKEKEQQ